MNPSQGEKYLREMTKSGMRKLKSADLSNTMSKGGSILPRDTIAQEGAKQVQRQRPRSCAHHDR